MASTALTTTNGSKGRGVASFSMGNFDPKKAAERAERMAKAIGGSVGGSQRFPGQKYSYSQGIWYKGAGKKKVPLAGEQSFVMLPMQFAATWVKWEDKKPSYLPNMYLIADGADDLPERDTLGDTDTDEWDRDDKGQPQDPWKPVAVIPMRTEDGETIDHIELQTKSAVIAVFTLFREIAEAMPSHMGEVPIVSLGTKKAEMKRTVTKQRMNKKTKAMEDYEDETTFRWDAPVFEVVGWTEMKACDDPNGAVPEATGEVGGVETRERVETKPAAVEDTVKGKKKKAKVVEDDGDSI